jgi:hypothetical protein
MTRKRLSALFAAVLALVAVLPVLATAPAQGLVVEGQRVPGIALGGSRAEVEAAYGQPASCQNLPYYDGRQGLKGICRFDVDGGGQVTVHYRAADGGPAQDSPADIVFIIRWAEAVSGWKTAAGINTTRALNDPDSVIAAYPLAIVTYNSLFGNIESIEDKALGILIDYTFDYLSATKSVNMAISFPREPPPAPELETRVTDIDLTAGKVKGSRHVRALVRVQDEQGSSARGASVSATWSLHDGNTQAVEAVASRSGYAFFEVFDVPRGTVTLIVDDVVLAGHEFDPDHSVLWARIRVK